MLPLSVRGAWIDLMIFMWESKERGVLTATMPEFAMMMSCTLEEANFAIGLLFEKGVCDFEVLPNGMTRMISRRMVRDAEIARKRSESGSLGGRPKSGKQKHKQNESKPQSKTKANAEYENDNGIDNENPLTKEPEKVHERKVPRGTDTELWDVEDWTDDVLSGNDEVFTNMIKSIPVNGQLDPLARSHLGLCSRYGWHKKMETQQTFRNSLINHITKELQDKKYAQAQRTLAETSPTPGKDYTERF